MKDTMRKGLDIRLDGLLEGLIIQALVSDVIGTTLGNLIKQYPKTSNLKCNLQKISGDFSLVMVLP